MITPVLIIAGLTLFFWMGYKYGRRVERWAQNHKKNETVFNKEKDDRC
jgi:hypothetical protein